jgi:L-seryl-tRNA(Ser) seleniumtransferase
MTTAFRSLPSVDRLLAEPGVKAAIAELGNEVVTTALRDELAQRRAAIGGGAGAPDAESIAAAAVDRAYAALRASLKPVINATGVIIHTNLGRAPLAASAIAAMAAVNRGYSNLEYDLDAGERGSRYAHVEALLRRLTAAEAAIAVNNNAAALLLALSALTRDREVILSRGQLVEIGGGFRIPDVMRQSGADLVEVGTTNRTYLADYAAAVTERTAAAMRVHTSNFKISGFTASASLEELTGLARERGLLLLDDIGSGCLLDTRAYGLAAEPTPQASIAAGADLVLFSGDKLLGGPQAGIVVGRAPLIDRLRRHPLARALRLDKGTIAALNATLIHYVKGDAVDQVPVWQMIATPAATVRRRAGRWARALGGAAVEPGRSMIGGGSLPEEGVPTHLLALRPSAIAVEELARRLRSGTPAVVGRIEHDALLLDPRTVQPDEEQPLLDAVRRALTA